MALGKETRSALRDIWDLEITLLNDQLNVDAGGDKQFTYLVVSTEIIFATLFTYWEDHSQHPTPIVLQKYYAKTCVHQMENTHLLRDQTA